MKPVIELDGSQHADSSYDRKRDAFMQAQGYSILRFGNTDALKRHASVCETIIAALQGGLAGNVLAPELRFILSHSQQREAIP